ncbi:MAG: hypothetical protein GXO91_09320 [FCB group bacterium]|nr:hypothetical protein [FCB group bacterium]
MITNRFAALMTYSIIGLFILGPGLGSSLDSEDCEELNEAECQDTAECAWDDSEGCHYLEDGNSEEDYYTFRAHAKFEIVDDENDDDMFGKLKIRITEASVNILEFDISNLAPLTIFSVLIDGFWQYSFTTDNNGEFVWVMRSDGNGDEMLPALLMPVSSLVSVNLLDENDSLIVSELFVPDDQGCEDLTMDVCSSLPYCAWDPEEGCNHSDWSFEPNENWEPGENFYDDMIGEYGEYLDNYNLTGEGLFNYVTISGSALQRWGRSIDIGSEIGLLDYNGIVSGPGCTPIYGQTVVGSGVWNGGPLTLFAFGSFSNCNSGGSLFPGFVPANPIVVRILNPVTQFSYDLIMTATWGGSQSFGNIVLTPVPVDINGDGLLNIVDIVEMVDMALGGTTPTVEADYNQDGNVDILDIVLIAGIILGNS